MVEALLALEQVKLFLCVDEVQDVWRRACPGTRRIVAELARIGASKTSVMHCVLSGSSHHLRGLIKGEPSLEFMHAEGFAHYAKYDLNGTKFVPVSIYPFLDVSDCRAVAGMHCARMERPLRAEAEGLTVRQRAVTAILLVRRHRTGLSRLNVYTARCCESLADFSKRPYSWRSS